MGLNDLDKIRELESKLETAQERYLRISGWEHTCNHPGSYWLWEKTINGKHYCCGRRTALDIQAATEEPNHEPN